MATTFLLATARHIAGVGRHGLPRAQSAALVQQQMRHVSKIRKAQKKAQKIRERQLKNTAFIPRSVLSKQGKAGSIKFDKDALMRRAAMEPNHIGVITEPPVMYFHDILQSLREINAPEIKDNMDGFVIMETEMDMRTDKQTKFKANFSKTIMLPHNFEEESKNRVLVFCETEDQKNAAYEAGAVHAGEMDVVKAIEKGEISQFEYTHVICTHAMFPPVSKLRKILKEKFPQAKEGQVTEEVAEAVQHYRLGKTVTTTTDISPELGTAKVKLGRLSMSDEELRANMIAYLDMLTANKGYKSKDYGPFVQEARINLEGGLEKYILHLPTAKLDPEGIANFALGQEQVQEEAVAEKAKEKVEDVVSKVYASEEERLADLERQKEEALQQRIKEQRVLMNMSEKARKNYLDNQREKQKAEEEAEKQFEERLKLLYRQKKLSRLSKKVQLDIDLDSRFRKTVHI